jgi:hypothetical protein
MLGFLGFAFDFWVEIYFAVLFACFLECTYV